MSNNSWFNWLSPKEAKPTAPTQNLANFYIGGGTTRTGEVITPEKALENPTVFACVNFIAQSVAQLPWSVVKKDSESFSPVSNPVNDRLSNPNSDMTPYELKYRIVVDLLTYGNCYLLKIVTTSGRVTELIPMDADKMTAQVSMSGKRTYKHEGGKEYPSDRIIHIRDFVGGSVAGLSKVNQCANLVAIDNAIDNQIADVFRNGASIGGVLQYPEGIALAPGSADALADTWAKNFGPNSKRRGGVAVLENGGTFHQVDNLSPADADALRLKQQTMTRIGAVFKVPSYALEIADGSKYSNLQSRMTSFYRDSIAPIVKNISSKMAMSLLTNEERKTLSIGFDSSELIKGDLQSASVVAVNAYNSGVLSRNESRALMGFNSLEEDKFTETETAEPIQPTTGNENGPRDN